MPSFFGKELLADLVGEYLFTDSNFVENLSTKNPGLFKRIYEEIKYLAKTFAGTKQGAALEKVKKTFAEIYRDADVKNTAQTDGVRYSIVNLDTGKSYVQATRQVIHGDTVAEWRSEISDFFNRALKNGPIEIETIEGDMLTISKNTADKARSKTVTENGVSRELTDKEFLVKLHAEAHIDELAEISHKNNRPPVPDGKNHSFAKDGFTYRTVYFQDFDGSYYRITLSVGENSGISTVYNVGKIKADDIPDGKIISTIGSKADMSSTKLSISRTDGNVNSKNSPTDIPAGGYRITGEDIALAPTKEDIAQMEQGIATAQTAPRNDTEELGAPTREDILQMEMERELYGDWRMTDPLDRKVEKLYRLMLREQISEEDYNAQLVKADRQYQQRGSRVEDALERIRQAYSTHQAVTADESAAEQKAVEAVLGEKGAYVSKQANALYDEVKSMQKGKRVSNTLSYLLDTLDLSEEHKAESYNSSRTALLNIRDNPNQVVNPNSAVEAAAREMLGREYDSMAEEFAC